MSNMNARRMSLWRARVRQEAMDTLEQRMAETGCRRLTGAEFERRKAELEARERERQEKAE